MNMNKEYRKKKRARFTR